MTSTQAAYDAIDAAKPDAITRAKCRALITGYDARYKDAGLTCESAEEWFRLPVVNPATGCSSRTFTQLGCYDGIVSHAGRRFLLEHKTTSEQIADPNAVYWRTRTIDQQVSMYALANWQSGEKIDGTIYDVIKKPTIRPKSIPKGSPKADRLAAWGTQQEIVRFGTYCGFDVPVDESRTTETPDLYEMRLTADTLERPAVYFQRRIIPRLDSDILEWANELWDVGQDILAARNNERWYRNSGACSLYGAPCEYLSLCSGHDDTDSDNWESKVSSKNTLSHSRIRCFQTCRRKYFYRYEMGIQKAEQEEREALYFGSIFHAALEAWLLTFRKDV